MRLYNETGENLSKVVGISRSTLSLKMNGKSSEFTLSEIKKIKNHYNLTAEQVEEIFFN